MGLYNAFGVAEYFFSIEYKKQDAQQNGKHRNGKIPVISPATVLFLYYNSKYDIDQYDAKHHIMRNPVGNAKGEHKIGEGKNDRQRTHT